jgi:hypothetical protein
VLDDPTHLAVTRCPPWFLDGTTVRAYSPLSARTFATRVAYMLLEFSAFSIRKSLVLGLLINPDFPHQIQCGFAFDINDGSDVTNQHSRHAPPSSLRAQGAQSGPNLAIRDPCGP